MDKATPRCVLLLVCVSTVEDLAQATLISGVLMRVVGLANRPYSLLGLLNLGPDQRKADLGLLDPE
jgi:hypothetical protein